MVLNACDPSSQETEAGRLRVCCQFGLNSDTLFQQKQQQKIAQNRTNT
jgi:hypothetical protein